MVIVNHFQVQLVSAEDDTTPFKEHTKGEETYVEVEPDAEYFIAMSQVRPSSDHLYCEVWVDGKNKIMSLAFRNNRVSPSPRLCGILSRSNGISTSKALKFVPASFQSVGIQAASTMIGTGQISLKVYRGVYLGIENQARSSSSSLEKPSIVYDASSPATTKKMRLRSGEGSQIRQKRRSTGKYVRGEYLYAIVLHYCATPGLIAAGILSKPPLWESQRILHPKSNATEKSIDCAISVKRNRKGQDDCIPFECKSHSCQKKVKREQGER